ncbi:MAG TPA: hypothetical protein VMF32_18110 [Xanthobacteraceae bacterium]|nr:hypothetical protein [Xanthobacteraceae bacterium]
MKITARSMLANFLLLASLVATIPTTASFAQTPGKPLKEALIGHWQLVSVTANERTPYGTDPHGSMFIDGAGHFSIIVISSGGARSVAYYGTYTVNDADKLMTLHLEDSVGGGTSNAAGRDLKRLVVLNGDEMTIQNERQDGSPGTIKLTWKKAT